MLRLAAASVLLAAAPAARAQAPAWAVNAAGFEQSMNVIATVSVGGARLSAPGDRLAAFVGGTVRGVAAPTVVNGSTVFFLSVYANTGGEPVTFKAYDAAANTVRDLSATLTFTANAVTGSVSAPFALAPGTAGGGGGGGGTPGDPWRVTPSSFSRSMSLVGEVRYASGDGAGASDVVAAFVGSEVRGVATTTEVDGRRVFFLTAYANTDGEALTFKLATGGVVREIGAPQTFASDAVAGTLIDPLVWTVAGGPGGGSDNPAAWAVNAAGFDRSMNVVAALFSGGARSTDPADRIAAFVGSEVRGVASPQQVGGTWVAFLTIYGRAENEVVRFKALDASSGEVLAVAGTRVFATNAVLGTPGQPVVLAGQGGAGVVEDPRGWSVTPSSFEQSMNAVAEVRVGGALASAAGTRVAAFVDGQVRGVGTVSSSGGSAGSLVFLTVHGRAGDGAVSYKAFDGASGRVYDAAQTRTFEANRVDGQPGAPLVIDTAPDPTSLFVYPGDANGDGRVSQNDLFPLSFYFGLSGPARANAGVQFRAELAAAWSPAAASTADMNGDGRINQNDLFPLGFNFGRTRAAGAFFSAAPDPGSVPRLSAAGTSGAATLTGVPSSLDLRAGDTLRVAVSVSGAGASRAVGFQLRFDATTFEPVGRARGALFASAFGTGDALDLAKLETGRVSYAATLTTAPSVGDGEVVVVRLRVRASASGNATLAFSATEALNDRGETVALAATPLTVRVSGTTAAERPSVLSAVTLSDPAPNPARTSALVRVRIASPGHVRVTLTDVTGRIVATPFDGPLAPADDQVLLLDTSALASGLYLIRADTPQGTATRTLVVQR